MVDDLKQGSKSNSVKGVGLATDKKRDYNELGIYVLKEVL